MTLEEARAVLSAWHLRRPSEIHTQIVSLDGETFGFQTLCWGDVDEEYWDMQEAMTALNAHTAAMSRTE